jgi:hypothetical protein
MIRARLYQNHFCLKCNKVKSVMVRLGALDFCKICWLEEFNEDECFTVDSKHYEVYKKWLKVCHENQVA